MSARIATRADVPGMTAAWNSSQPVVASRHPGGATAVRAWTDLEALIYLTPPRRAYVADETAIGGPSVAGFFGVHFDNRRLVTLEMLAILTTGLTVARARARVRRLVKDCLPALCDGLLDDAGIIVAVSPDATSGNNVPSTVVSIASELGLASTASNGLRRWSFTAAQARAAVTAFVP